jgi:elongation factor Ts
MSVDAKTVVELRKMTGAGMMDAKKALEECGGDLEKAADELRKTGVAKADKRAGRETSEGRVYAYIHSNNKVGAIVKVTCETDFVARNEDFEAFCHDLAMHIVAADPEYMTREDVPADVVAKEKELFAEEMKNENKPEDVIEKIVEGKMNKFYSENCLMEQAFIKDEEKTIESLLKEKIATIGENIQIAEFSKLTIG